MRFVSHCVSIYRRRLQLVLLSKPDPALGHAVLCTEPRNRSGVPREPWYCSCAVLQTTVCKLRSGRFHSRMGNREQAYDQHGVCTRSDGSGFHVTGTLKIPEGATAITKNAFGHCEGITALSAESRRRGRARSHRAPRLLARSRSSTAPCCCSTVSGAGSIASCFCNL